MKLLFSPLHLDRAPHARVLRALMAGANLSEEAELRVVQVSPDQPLKLVFRVQELPQVQLSLPKDCLYEESYGAEIRERVRDLIALVSPRKTQEGSSGITETVYRPVQG
jgi:hypothetical protein